MTHEQLAAMEWALEVLGCIYSPVNERDIEEVGTRMATLRTIIEQAKRQQTLAAPVPDVSLIDEGKTAAPVQEGRDWSLLEATQESLREHMAEIGRLKAIIDAAGQQEPVAWAVHYKGPIPLFTKTKSEAEAWGGNKIVPLYTTPPAAPVQEPVAWRHDMGEENGGWEYFEEASCPECQPLYTSPPASKPLTDEQIMEMYNEPRSDAEMIAFARAIEAAHGIGEQK